MQTRRAHQESLPRTRSGLTRDPDAQGPPTSSAGRPPTSSAGRPPASSSRKGAPTSSAGRPPASSSRKRALTTSATPTSPDTKKKARKKDGVGAADGSGAAPAKRKSGKKKRKSTAQKQTEDAAAAATTAGPPTGAEAVLAAEGVPVAPPPRPAVPRVAAPQAASQPTLHFHHRASRLDADPDAAAAAAAPLPADGVSHQAVAKTDDGRSSADTSSGEESSDSEAAVPDDVEDVEGEHSGSGDEDHLAEASGNALVKLTPPPCSPKSAMDVDSPAPAAPASPTSALPSPLPPPASPTSALPPPPPPPASPTSIPPPPGSPTPAAPPMDFNTETNTYTHTEDSAVPPPLFGASRTEGGILRGRALGSAPKLADIPRSPSPSPAAHPPTFAFIHLLGSIAEVRNTDPRSTVDQAIGVPIPPQSSLPAILRIVSEDALVDTQSGDPTVLAWSSVGSTMMWLSKGPVTRASQTPPAASGPLTFIDINGVHGVHLAIVATPGSAIPSPAPSAPASATHTPPPSAPASHPSSRVATPPPAYSESDSAPKALTEKQLAIIEELGADKALINLSRNRHYDIRGAYARYMESVRLKAELADRKADKGKSPASPILRTAGVRDITDLFIGHSYYGSHWDKNFKHIHFLPEVEKWFKNPSPTREETEAVWGPGNSDPKIKHLEKMLVEQGILGQDGKVNSVRVHQLQMQFVEGSSCDGEKEEKEKEKEKKSHKKKDKKKKKDSS